jgi:hypothetical protein
MDSGSVMNDLIWYDITCHTDGCEWNNVTVRGQGPAESEFMCGPCGGMVDDWKISEDQTDGL